MRVTVKKLALRTTTMTSSMRMRVRSKWSELSSNLHRLLPYYMAPREASDTQISAEAWL